MGFKAENLINTSVDDCRATIRFFEKKDIPELEKALNVARKLGQKTRTKVLELRLKALKREVV